MCTVPMWPYARLYASVCTSIWMPFAAGAQQHSYTLCCQTQKGQRSRTRADPADPMLVLLRNMCMPTTSAPPVITGTCHVYQVYLRRRSAESLLLRPDFLNIVTGMCNAPKVCTIGRLRLLVAHSAYKLQTAGPLCSGKSCCCPVTWERGLSIVYSRLQRAGPCLLVVHKVPTPTSPCTTGVAKW